MNYYPFHIADWALHTNHLTLEEEGVYRRILDYYYDTETPIPNNQEKTQWVIRRLRLQNHQDIFAAILAEFFVLENDGWHSARADREIFIYRNKAETARVNGKRGGRPKKNNDLHNKKPTKTYPVICSNREITGSKANQEPRTNNQEPILKDDLPSEDSSPPPMAKADPVPFEKIVALYHRVLPTLPRCVKLSESRKGQIRQRHVHDLKTIERWEEFFNAVGRSDFLMGRTPGSGGKPPFLADLTWITNQNNFLKIAEGRYHRG